jgi:hypothetical protein
MLASFSYMLEEAFCIKFMMTVKIKYDFFLFLKLIMGVLIAKGDL